MTQKKTEDSKKTELDYEKSFHRLEIILEKMNSGAISLDESLKLYEEADSLILSCGKKLAEAEQRIEMLIKNRDGTLSTKEDMTPLTKPYPE